MANDTTESPGLSQKTFAAEATGKNLIPSGGQLTRMARGIRPIGATRFSGLYRHVPPSPVNQVTSWDSITLPSNKKRPAKRSSLVSMR